MSQINWTDWHDQYRRPSSPLNQRLRVVQRYVRDGLDRCPPGSIRTISICAGQGQDVLGVLKDHARRSDVLARLVELDEGNVASAREIARAADLFNVQIEMKDASLTDAYQGMVPANLVLVCGVFGNIATPDIRRTIRYLPSLCAPGATVIWTRHCVEPDVLSGIRTWFVESAFTELDFTIIAETWGVGANQFSGEPSDFEGSVRLFDFVGYRHLSRRSDGR